MFEDIFSRSHGVCSIHGQSNNRYGYCRKCIEDPNIAIYHCKKCGTPKVMHHENFMDLLRENPQQLYNSCICKWDDAIAEKIKHTREQEEKEEKEKIRNNQIKERQEALREKFSHSKKLGCLIWFSLFIIWSICMNFIIKRYGEGSISWNFYMLIGVIILFGGRFIARMILDLIYNIFIGQKLK